MEDKILNLIRENVSIEIDINKDWDYDGKVISVKLKVKTIPFQRVWLV